jgi:hypothetical protein
MSDQMNFADLDALILSSLDELRLYLASHDWRGRENELVNLFAFGHLLPRACPPNGMLDPTQFAIEVALPQLPDWGKSPKRDVRKDLIIWREPRITNWTKRENKESAALAVIEWKSLNNIGIKERVAAKKREHEGDIDWLRRTTARSASLSGYAIFADLTSSPPTLACTVVRSGEVAKPATAGRGATR